MKNAEIEIIRFDAQDVITTSGGLTAWFKVSRALVPGEGFEDFTDYENNASWRNELMTWETIYLYNMDTEPYSYFNEGSSYTLTEGVSSYVLNSRIDISGTTPGGGTPETELHSFKAIMDWLDTYGKKQ